VLTAGPENHEVAAFLRLDRASQPVDHHSIVLFESRKPESTTARSRPRTTTRSRPRTTGCATTTGRTRSARADTCWAARSSTTGSTLGTEARALRRRRPVHRITRDRAAPHRPIANRPVGARAAPRLRRVMSRDSTTTAWSLVTYRTGDDPVERVGSLGPKGVVRAMPELCEYRGLMPALEDWPEVAAILEPLQGVRGGRKGPRSAPVPQEDPLRRSQLLVTSARNGRIPGPGALEDPSFFLLPATSIVGHGGGDPIEIPTDDHANVDWEGELAVVIGRPARNVSVESARAHVARYTICNDISARGFHQRTSYPAPPF
jgi:hypothetical protein